MTHAALQVRGLSVSFGGVRAVVDVDLDVLDNQLVALIGPNGAGKTTLVDAVAGFVPYAGEVMLDGQRLAGKPAHHRARLGLARTWQTIELFDDLTVHENLSVASARLSTWQLIGELVQSPRRARQDVERTLELLGLLDVSNASPAELPQGQRKLVGIARALVSGPRVLCLDEPAAGLNTEESRDLGLRLRDVVDAGTAVLLIDHDVGLVLSISDYLYVLEFGSVIASGTPREVRSDERVIAAYLGESHQVARDGEVANGVES